MGSFSTKRFGLRGCTRSIFAKSVRNLGRADGPKSTKMSEMDVRPQVRASNNAKLIAEGPGTSGNHPRCPKPPWKNKRSGFWGLGGLAGSQHRSHGTPPGPAGPCGGPLGL